MFTRATISLLLFILSSCLSLPAFAAGLVDNYGVGSTGVDGSYGQVSTRNTLPELYPPENSTDVAEGWIGNHKYWKDGLSGVQHRVGARPVSVPISWEHVWFDGAGDNTYPQEDYPTAGGSWTIIGNGSTLDFEADVVTEAGYSRVTPAGTPTANRDGTALEQYAVAQTAAMPKCGLLDSQTLMPASSELMIFMNVGDLASDSYIFDRGNGTDGLYIRNAPDFDLVYQVGGSSAICSSCSFAANSEHHFAIVKDGAAAVHIVVDGIEITAWSAALPTATWTAGNVAIGCRTSGSARMQDAYWREVIYNTSTNPAGGVHVTPATFDIDRVRSAMLCGPKGLADPALRELFYVTGTFLPIEGDATCADDLN